MALSFAKQNSNIPSYVPESGPPKRSSMRRRRFYFKSRPIVDLLPGMLARVPTAYIHSADYDELAKPNVTVLVLKTDALDKHETFHVAVLDTEARSENFIELKTLEDLERITETTAEFGNSMSYISLEAGCVIDPGLNPLEVEVYWKRKGPIILASWAKKILGLQAPETVESVESPFLWPIAADQIPSGTLGEVSPDLLSAECFNRRRRPGVEDTGNAIIVVFLTDTHNENPLQVAFFTKREQYPFSTPLEDFGLVSFVKQATAKNLNHIVLKPKCRLNPTHGNIPVKVYCVTQEGPMNSHYPVLDVEHGTWSHSSKDPKPDVIKIDAQRVEIFMKLLAQSA
ncbi:hypothetical protein H0H93_006381, partial [Arthromyces matolae]